MASTGASRRRESALLNKHRKLRASVSALDDSEEQATEEDLLLLNPPPSPVRRTRPVGGDGMFQAADDLAATHDHHETNKLDLMDFGRTRRSRMSFVSPDAAVMVAAASATSDGVHPGGMPPTNYGALMQALANEEAENGDDDDDDLHDEPDKNRQRLKRPQLRHPCPAHGPVKSLRQGMVEIWEQLPAIIATVLLVLMVAIPFGVAYFPIQWSSNPNDESAGTDDDDDLPGGPFPLPGKEQLGIRMALFATFAGQLVMTFGSHFTNPVAFQLLENVPFYHALAHTVIQEQGYGIEALSTLFFLFGLSSVLVGCVFYTLGKFHYGRVVYFFPGHVLVGCIGGIGVFIIISSIEVTNNWDFTFDRAGLEGFVDNLHLFGLVVVLEVLLRILSAVLVDGDGNPKYRFLAPIYFCSIVPAFYVGWFALGFTTEEAQDWGYLFPDPSACEDCPEAVSFHEKVFNGHVMDIFRIIDFRLISWTAVAKSSGTLIALCSFSLIHVPINIPAFAVSSNVDVDMNNELVAHGYSNMLSGLFGGLQNVMTYSFSVLFQKSGGGGIPACLAVTAGVALMFVYGPAIAVYFPRCMAGTLLLHIGLDLFLEGCYDSYGKFDSLEYAGIWLITIVMSSFGMTAALLAGILSALSTYAVQSITHLDPIFRIMHATTLRSSAWGRSSEAMAVLENTDTGRSRILIVQLQGHLFFGNVADLTDKVKDVLAETKTGQQQSPPIVVIMDFSLVVGMDSSAAHAIAKLKGLMHKLYEVEVSIFVTGTHREGFPCAYALTEALSSRDKEARPSQSVDLNDVLTESPNPSRAARGAVGVSAASKSFKAVQAVRCADERDGYVSYDEQKENRVVCSSLDEALIFAEDVLVARVNPSLLHHHHQQASTTKPSPRLSGRGSKYNAPPLVVDFLDSDNMTEEQERAVAELFMENIVPMTVTPEVRQSIKEFVSKCVRKEFQDGDVLWHEGDESNSANILVWGSIRATLETGTCGPIVAETVARGNIFGELGLVDGTRRLSTVTCASPRAVVYSLQRDVFDAMVQANQLEARLLERIAIRYLAHRVQHVSNRIFDTHCLPI